MTDKEKADLVQEVSRRNIEMYILEARVAKKKIERFIAEVLESYK